MTDVKSKSDKYSSRLTELRREVQSIRRELAGVKAGNRSQAERQLLSISLDRIDYCLNSAALNLRFAAQEFKKIEKSGGKPRACASSSL